MAENIARGSLADIWRTDGKQSPPSPVFQVLQVKELPKVSDHPTRHRIVLSDGDHYVQAMLSTHLNALVFDKKVDKGSLLRLNGFTLNAMKERKIMIVLDAEAVENVGQLEKFGNPRALVSVNDEPAQNTTAPQGASAQSFYGASANKPPMMDQMQEKEKPKAKVASKPPTGILMIEGLSPYQNRWTIKARVTSKSDIRHWHNQRGEGKLFSVNLMDESGEIRATGFNNEVDMLYDVLQEGSAYFITKCRVNIAKKQFTNINHEYELMFERDSEVTKCEDQSAVPQIRYDFKKIGDISEIEKDSTCDVIGVIKDIGEVSEITSKTTSKAVSKRDVTLVDNTGFSIRLTVWGKTAQGFSAEPNSVLACKGVKVSDFNGRSLSMFSSSTMAIDPDISEAHLLKGWYDAQGRGESFQTHQSASGSAGAQRKDQKKTLLQVQEENLGMGEMPDYYTCKATIIFIKKDNISYPACPSADCNKKVNQDTDGSWRCERCDKSFPKPQYRYIMTFSVHDHTGQQWFNAFDDVGRLVIGKSADELTEIKENSEEEYNDILARANCNTYVFRVRAKQDQYNGNVRIRHNVMNASPLNFVQESVELAEMIDKYL